MRSSRRAEDLTRTDFWGLVKLALAAYSCDRGDGPNLLEEHTRRRFCRGSELEQSVKVRQQHDFSIKDLQHMLESARVNERLNKIEKLWRDWPKMIVRPSEPWQAPKKVTNSCYPCC